MSLLIDHLKASARVLQRQVSRGEPEALSRLGLQPQSTEAERSAVQRRHCLAVIAKELGFSSWSHALNVLDESPSPGASVDFGTLLYPARIGGAHWNIWCADYEEAQRIRAEHGGFLLPYKRQFFICDQHFIQTIGLDPKDPDWESIGRDWARPASVEARSRLYRKVIEARLPAPSTH